MKALGATYRGNCLKLECNFLGSLQWRPLLENICAKLYSSIRRSLSIPINLRGIGDAVDAHFGDLIQKNAYLFSGVYKQIEIAVSILELFRINWLSLATPANIDIGERLKGKSIQEWARVFI